MRRLMITGEAGFVGRHALAMSDEINQSHGWELAAPSAGYDLLDAQSLMRLVAEARPDAVIHLAGISFVPDSVRDPAGTFKVNVLGSSPSRPWATGISSPISPGRWSLEEALELLRRDTRRYAKRQLTWFRADPEVRWFAPSQGEESLDCCCGVSSGEKGRVATGDASYK